MDTPERAGPTGLTTSAVTMYTVPAATTAVLRTMQVANDTASEQALTISIGADGSTTRIASSLPVPAYGTYTWTGFIPLSAGETIQAKAGANSALVFTAGLVEIT